MTSDFHFIRAHHLVLTYERAGASLRWNEHTDRLEVANDAQVPLDVRQELEALAGVDLPPEARTGLESRACLRQVLKAQGLPARELLCTPVAALGGLPIPFTLLLEQGATKAYVTSSRHAYAAALEAKVPTFLVREIESAALAAELDRAGPKDMAQWVENKRRAPEWRVTHASSGALDVRGVTERRAPTWSVGRALRQLGMDLVSVELHEAKGET